MMNADLIKKLIEFLPIGLMVLDEHNRLILWNGELLAQLGIKNPGRENVPLEELMRKFPTLKQELCSALAAGASFDLNRLMHGNKYLTMKGRNMEGLKLIASVDVTKEVRQELDGLQNMFAEQETEQQRLSEEIHDGIGPLLSAIKLSLEGMAAQVSLPTPAFRKNYHNALDLLHTASEELRAISHALMPGALVDFGLPAALENLCRQVRESGRVQVNFYRAGLEMRLETAMERSLYRIAQELLNNAFKHAQASTINVQLIQHPKSVVLMVEDDGIGFDREELKRLAANGIGLRNIRMRTRTMGGTFSLESRPGQGVLATVELPVR